MPATEGAREAKRPSSLRAAIRDAGRVPVQRNTSYGTIRRFDDPAQDPDERLEAVGDGGQFGSYDKLVDAERWRYRGARR